MQRIRVRIQASTIFAKHLFFVKRKKEETKIKKKRTRMGLL